MDILQARLQQQPDYYQKIDRALASIRVLENYVKVLVYDKKINAEELSRIQQLVEHFILPNSYSAWHLIRASAALELDMLEEVQQSLTAIEKYLKLAELGKVLSLYAKLMLTRPNTDKVLALHGRFERHILRNDTASLNMGNMLLAVGQSEQALVYFYHVLGKEKRYDISTNYRQALVGIGKCSGLEVALTLYDELLDHNKSLPNYEKIKNTIRRLIK